MTECPICQGGPNGHTFDCAVLNLRGDVLETEPNNNPVLLYSGGMDSLIAWEKLGRPPTLYVDLHHRYAETEWARCLETISDTQRFELRTIGAAFEKPGAEIPLRNLYLAMVAANLGYDQIWLSVQRNEMAVPDRTPEFFEETSALLTRLLNRPIQVATPVADLDKVEMVAWYIAAGGDVKTLKRTWACYQPRVDFRPDPKRQEHPLYARPGVEPKYRVEEHCGDCPACFRRFVAMHLNGVTEDWHHRVFNSATARHYLARAQAGAYPPDRAAQIMEALAE